MKNNIVPMVIVVIIVAAAAFYGGMKYQQSKSNAANMQMTGTTANGGRRGQFAGRNGQFGGGTRPTVGEVVSTDDKSLTVKMMDGSSKIILLSDKTQVSKTDKVTTADIKTGDRVAVTGTANSDGSITATSVQVNPLFNMGGKAPNQAVKSPDAKEIVIEGKNFSFSPNKITVMKGQKTRIVFKNVGGMHDFRADELNIATAVIGDGQEDFVEFTPDKAGSYEFYCSVGNHRAMGMVGTITVQ